MARERVQLKEICQRYKIRVIDVEAMNDHYLLETNRGPKELHIWPRLDVLRWSFAWRERLARQGFREVERFIRTRDAKPYVIIRKIGYTLNDHLRDACPLSPSLEHAFRCGQLVARMHQAQAASDYPYVPELLKREQNRTALEVKRARELYRQLEMRAGELDPARGWIARQVPPLLERMERSAELLASPLLTDEWLAPSHPDLGLENLAWVDGKLFLRGFWRPNMSVQPRDIAFYLQQLYQQGRSLDLIDAFLDGYEQIKTVRYRDYLLLLAFMAFPEQAWRQVEHAINAPSPDDQEAVSAIRQTLRQQQELDQMLTHIAGRAVGKRGADEPI
ncbi:MAG: phosphotransferase [Brevibacillus sp.]|nr:phosphotransferase [Brevibacillus sp.]